MKVISGVVFFLFYFWLALPAQSHSPSALNEWLVDWEQRTLLEKVLPESGVMELQLFLSDLTNEYLDMRERHPWWNGLYTEIRETTTSFNGIGQDVEQWRSLVSIYFSDVETALCIMDHESGGNPLAKNDLSSAAGLFQFLQSTWDDMVPLSITKGLYASGAPYDPEKNVRAAAWLQQAEGWSQWSPYRECV